MNKHVGLVTSVVIALLPPVVAASSAVRVPAAHSVGALKQHSSKALVRRHLPATTRNQ